MSAQVNAAVAAARLLRLRNAFGQSGMQAFFARKTSDIAWLTAFDNLFDEEDAHALFVDGTHARFHTDSRYSAAARTAAQGGPIQVDDARESHAKWVTDLIADAPASVRSLGIEDTMALGEFRRLEHELTQAHENPNLVETQGLITGLRAVKDAGEVARMRNAQAITDAAFSHIVQYMKPGMTERAVQLELEDFMVRHGASGLAFGSIVATGANGASPHAIPGDTLLEAGQCVVMDFGARAAGYCSDMTRTVFVGAPDAHLANAYTVLREANEQVEALLASGVTGAQAHERAEDVLAAGGFAGKMGHALGHGVGMDIHELPVLAPRNTEALVAGNVVTVEPGIYLDGDFGMRLEDFGVITQDGFEVFTQSTHEMVII